MKNLIENTQAVLMHCISGFHQYILQKPAHLVFVSQNLCDMTGYTEKELLSESSDLYANLVHPADSKRYADFIDKLSKKEQSATLEYRIVQKDGKVRYVSDTVTVKALETGILAGYSVLTDITALKHENDNLRFLNETIPCGFMKYTCDKHPKITYVNEQLLKILRFPEGDDVEPDYLELYKDNIYLMIPMEERRRFAHFLRQVYTQDSSISGEISVLRFDGTKARVYGWVTKVINEKGQEEFQTVCMDVTERYYSKKAIATEQYLKALSEVFERIFEYDFSNNSVKYVYGLQSDTFGRIQNMPMHLEEATEQWIQNTVVAEDCARVKEFFQQIFQKREHLGAGKPPQICFRSVTAKGEIRKYVGIFLKIDISIYVFCCKTISDEQEADTLRSENTTLKKVNEMVMQFTDGVIAFELQNDKIKTFYSSDNVCHFFGYSKEEWLHMSQGNLSIEEFLAQSNVDYEDFEKLLETGEDEFTYIDLETKTPRRIKAVCSQKSPDPSAPRYVMLYRVNDSDSNNLDKTSEEDKIYIRTFGYFDVFVDGNPIAFRNKKSKELLALLVDRRGGYVSSEEAICFLWEDEDINAVTLARYRKVALRLKKILEEYDIADIVESIDGKRRIVTDKVRCDLYDYLSQKEEFAGLFKGSYLTNYSWGELTLGELMNQ